MTGTIREFIKQVAGRIVARAAYFPARRRYLYTRRGQLRLRYSALPLAVFLSIFAAAGFSGNRSHDSLLMAQLSSTAHEQSIRDMLHDRLTLTQKRLARYTGIGPEAGTESSGDFDVAALSTVHREQAGPRTELVTVGKGDTLAGLLHEAGVSGHEAFEAISALKPHFDPRDIRPGQKMNLRFEPADDNRSGYVLAAMDMPVDPLKSVSLRRTSGGGFVPDVIEKEAERRSYARAAEIETSLYGSALKNGIPSSVVAEVIRVFSWDVDFQRDVRRGDRLEVLYDQMESPDGVKVKSGNIIFARLSIGGEDVAIYRYEKPDGDVDYYMQDGSSLRKTLMKTPVDGARISSGYGMRKHPVLGYNKMHKGMDFAAPTGTPIYAAGDGKIEYLGRNSSYGNYIRIRHNGNLKTAYAHMSRFARGLSNGSRVKQGQVIGYVGTTGRSTGPHLHYEVLVNNVQINPKSISVPQGDSLKGKELEAFHRHVNRISQQYSSLLGGQQFASYGGPAIRRQDLR